MKNTAELGEKSRLDAELRVETLRSWYREDNRQFEKSLDRLSTDQIDRGIFESGVAIAEITKHSEDWRAKRDQVIDTAFARLKGLGVNTDTLGIKRRLPVNLRDFVRPRLKRLPINEWDLNGYGIDTL